MHTLIIPPTKVEAAGSIAPYISSQERHHRRDRCYQDPHDPEEKSTRLPLIDVVENCSTFTEECTDDELVEEIILEMVIK